MKKHLWGTSSILFIAFVLSLIPTSVWAQQQAPISSSIDKQLTIRTLSLLTPLDNVDGIYSKAVHEDLKDFLGHHHQFNFKPLENSDPNAAIVDLRDRQQEVQNLARSAEADGFFTVQINKGPKGISINVDLFLAFDGRLAATQTVKDLNRFELGEVKEQTRQLVQKTLKSLPFDGVILSRKDNKVTLNLGRKDGLANNQTINAILLLQVQRHPKFGFIVSTEKEVLGKIKLFKVEDSLSFGHIVYEKEKDAIQRFSKIGRTSEVTYSQPTEGGPVPTISNDSHENKEWVPIAQPSFGQVGLRLGLGTYHHSMTLNSGVGGIEGKTIPYPSFSVLGELWINPLWLVRGTVREALASYKNPRNNSTPAALTASNSTYSLQLGYNILLYNDFWGPKFTLLGGYYQYNSLVTHSTPTSFTTMRYGGFNLGIEGVLPIDAERNYACGATYLMVFQPSLAESPELSGREDSNSITVFSIFGRKKILENLHAVLSLEFEMYSSAWTINGTRSDGVSASTSAQTIQNVSGGINYLF